MLLSLGEYSIQIGDADKYVIGNHKYQLSYDYIIGLDLLDGADELYFNLIGTEWNTRIKNVSFEINMPKDFDNAKQNMIAASLVIIPALVLIAVLVIWSIFGKDKKIVDVVEFYPPKDTNCVGVAYWYKGMVSGEDVVPLLIELANEGYLTIEEDNTSGYSYIIRRVKSYGGDDESKKTFMSGLFKRGDTTYKAKLENDFYIYVDKIKLMYNTPDNRKKVFDKKSLMMRLACWLLSIAAVFLNFKIYTDTYHTSACNIAFAAGLAVCVLAFILSFFVRKRTDDGHMVLQQIEGFKTFLETAEKERLEELVEENPEYFYDILPYAYVLGVLKKWMKKFESIAIEPPTWCHMDHRDLGYLYFINSTLKNCSSSMQSRPIDTGTGGRSVSDGGFRVGGGGSW